MFWLLWLGIVRKGLTLPSANGQPCVVGIQNDSAIGVVCADVSDGIGKGQILELVCSRYCAYTNVLKSVYQSVRIGVIGSGS